MHSPFVPSTSKRLIASVAAVLLFLAVPIHASITLGIFQHPTGVQVTYSGTWSVSYAGSEYSPSYIITGTSTNQLFLQGTWDGDDYALDQFGGVFDLGAGESTPFRGTGSTVISNDPAPNSSGSPFGLIYSSSLDRIGLMGPDGGWTAGDTVNGNVTFPGETLSRLRFDEGSGFFNAGGQRVDWEVAVVPEPGTYAMLAAGLLAVVFLVRRRH